MAAPTRNGLAAVVCLILAALAPVFLASALSAQAPPSQEGFGENVEVNVVNVDVFVTDKDGNPVPGLEKSDFEIREDGKKVEITNFEAVDRGAAPGPGQSPGGPPGTAAPDPQMPSRSLTAGTAPADALQLVVYVDNFNIRPAHRARVLQQLRDFLTRELHPSDRVMLVTYDLGLQVRLPFTADRTALGRALDGAERLAANGSEAERAAPRGSPADPRHPGEEPEHRLARRPALRQRPARAAEEEAEAAMARRRRRKTGRRSSRSAPWTSRSRPAPMPRPRASRSWATSPRSR